MSDCQVFLPLVVKKLCKTSIRVLKPSVETNTIYARDFYLNRCSKA